MFDKKICSKCQEKISGKFDYCPYCGNSTSNKKEDWGLLGKNDMENPFEDISKSMFGGISGKMFNNMLGSAMKMLEKEMRKNIAPANEGIKSNFELYINGKKINPENIKVMKGPAKKKVKPQVLNSNHFDSENTKIFSSLPKKEPATNIRRLANKVIYEIEVPGVESIKDISIVKLENGLEIRAIGKDKAYKKVISIDLPILRYKLNDQKLVLELGDN